MKLVIMESPYAGAVEDNISYGRLCLRDCLRRGEAPIASHLLYTQQNVLDDNRPEERRLGIEAGLAWASRADYSVFYTDRGWSGGMREAWTRAISSGQPCHIRALFGPVVPYENSNS